MSRAPGRETNLYGDELLNKLRAGWAPLPTNTLLSLVLGGLQVRMMRSVVTMLSIVLAIAFLTYTGLSNNLYYNLVVALGEMEKTDTASPATIETAAKSVVAKLNVGTLTLDRQRGMAVNFGLDEIDPRRAELEQVRQQLVNAQSAVGDATQALAAIREDSEATDADIEIASETLVQAEQRVVALESDLQRLQNEVSLGEWLRDASKRPDEVEMLLGQTLTRHMRDMMLLAGTPGRLSPRQLEQLALVWPLVSGADEDVATLKNAIEQERIKRRATDLRLRLRKAAVDIDATLEGNPMDRWLIIMALLTCTVGIANAMLMSVTERFREIGTMKCLGAQDGLVVKVFLLESAMLGIVGAIAGIILGVIVAVLAAWLQFSSFGMANFPVSNAHWVIIGSIISGILLAVVGAVYPALVAARMNPVDALRVEE